MAITHRPSPARHRDRSTKRPWGSGTLLRAAQKCLDRFGLTLIANWRLHDRDHAIHLAALFERLAIDCVIDVGANSGGYGRFLREQVHYDGLIISFEPIPATAEACRRCAERYGDWRVITKALGGRSGAAPINVARDSVFTSFLQPIAQQEAGFAARNVVAGTEVVEIARLDELLPQLRVEHGFRNVFLKIDTQGYDREVLDGAGSSLAEIGALQTELSVRQIYAGMPTWLTSLQYLGDRGFNITGMYPVSRDEQMRVIEFDCVLINAILAVPEQHV